MGNVFKPKMTFSQIINMNVGFLGIQYSFGLQQSAVNPIYDMLGASPDEIPWLNLAGPLTGLIIQPIIGALSDKTWSAKWGRRKPYFFIGAVMCSLALLIYPFSSSLWMAAGLLWLLDAGNNTAMEPYRAFVADTLDDSQQPLGFQAQSFFTGLGQTLSNLSLFIFPLLFLGTIGSLPTWVYASFFLGSVCSLTSVWWSTHTTKEIPPTNEEILAINEFNKDKAHPLIQILSVLLVITFGPILFYIIFANIISGQALGLAVLPLSFVWVTFLYFIIKKFKNSKVANLLERILAPFIEIVEAIKDMPKVMWQLALVYLFQWYALFCYWQNSAKSVALSVWNTTPENKELYSKAVSWTGLISAWHNVVTFLFAFLLVGLAKKYSPRNVHFICLLLSAIGFIFFPMISNKYLLFFAITGFGVGWASMMGIPYLLVVSQIPKERYGVYMGIINMMIVIPMFIQTSTFGFVLKNFLHNDARNAITFAGILLFFAAAMLLFIKNKRIEDRVDSPIIQGHLH